MAEDIDILVPPDSIRDAAELLRGAGYSLLDSPHPLIMLEIERWHGRHKESVWRKNGGCHVGLHSHLADSPALIPSIVLPTLDTDELFAYLCVHGASSAWFRLKWISDLAGLIHDLGEQEVATLYARSQQLGAGRAAAQALLLVRELFGSGPGPGLEGELRSDPANRMLARIALSHLEGWLGSREPTRVPLGTTGIHASQLLLLPGMSFKLAELRRQLAAMR